MAFSMKPRKFAIRAQLRVDPDKGTRVGLVSQRTIEVNGKKKKAGKGFVKSSTYMKNGRSGPKKKVKTSKRETGRKVG